MDTTRRVALVIDINTTEPATHLEHTARHWIDQLVEHLANRGTTATPVRIDIDGWPHLIP